MTYVFGDQTQPSSAWFHRLDPKKRIRWATANQVHGHKVLLIGPENIPSHGIAGEADALLARHPGIGLWIRTADCLPLVIVQKGGPWFGIVHAGWRGLEREVICKTVQVLQAQGVSPSALTVQIGPHIDGRCYQVGSELCQRFASIPSAIISDAYLNMQAVACAQLVRMGVALKNIHSVHRCTLCDPQLASFRRNRTTARNISAVAVAV